jgi:cyclohexa-1,5-dienecarbonyl-CoA hydratase
VYRRDRACIVAIVKPAALTTRSSSDGAVRTLVLDGPPANVVGIATCEALVSELHAAEADDRTRLVVLRGAGAHFSYGASIEEHLPDVAPRMLRAMSAAVLALLRSSIPSLAAIHGRCLGGGLELALACGMKWATADAELALPEIKLGVFAPSATAMLPSRIGRSLAEEMLLTGRALSADEALRAGIVSRVVPSLDSAVDALADELRALSPIALRAATRAVRRQAAHEISSRLDALEALYASELLQPGREHVEGIRAFLEKRPPSW